MKEAMKIKEQTDRQREDTWIKKAGLTKRSKSTSPDGKIENRKPNGEKV